MLIVKRILHENEVVYLAHPIGWVYGKNNAHLFSSEQEAVERMKYLNIKDEVINKCIVCYIWDA